MSPTKHFIIFLICTESGFVKPSPGIHELGYSYPLPHPQPPPQFDEPTSPSIPIYIPPSPPFNQDDDFPPQAIPTYLPPNIYPPIGNPPLQEEIQPPIYNDDILIPSPPSNQYLPGSTRQSTPNFLQVINMSCLDSRDGSGYFRSTFRPTTSSARIFPVMEPSGSDCLVTSSSADFFRVDLEGQRMIDCGVRSCGSRMCLTLRMANIPGLRLADDSLVNLQCSPQESVVSQVKHLRINAQATNESVAVASGGSQRRFETSMSLLRKSTGSDVFDQPVQQGSAVRLGDELLLRTAVRDGDGWKSSRLGSVIIRSASSQRSITLVDENGCRVPAVRSISPLQPQQTTPLVVQLPFRAFLFQGAAPADDLLLSVRMVGCLRARDCFQSKPCDQLDGGSRSGVRVARQANFSSEEEVISDVENEFQFRVLPLEVPGEFGGNRSNFNGSVVVILLGSFCAVLLFALIFLMRPFKNKVYY